jgi:predicted acyl esterase
MMDAPVAKPRGWLDRYRQRLRRFREPVRTRPLPADIVVERDVAIAVRDGVTLYANVYRPAGSGRVPVILSCSPYGKDDFQGKKAGYHSFRPGILLGLDFGDIEVSEGTAFEAPDPAYWVPQGYAVVHYDTRGSLRSEGHMDLFSRKDSEDYYDVIEWAAARPWSTGRVGLCGVSYLAISQWFVASLRPPHLAAIIPWEGVSDLYRDSAFHGGIPETGFQLFYLWCLMRVRNKRFAPATNPLDVVTKHRLFDDFWQERSAALEKIEAPTLICASWSDHGLHTRGSFEAFARIASKQKFLFNHGREKWATFYSPEAVDAQRRFFDHFLKGDGAGPGPLPRVRLEVRSRRKEHVVKNADDFPVPGTDYKKLYLDASSGVLTRDKRPTKHTVRYRARKGRATFEYRFDEQTLLVGHMALRLWVSCAQRNDMDLFVGVEKLDTMGQPVFFTGFSGNRRDIVAKGWLRVSHRELDPDRTLPHRPFHPHTSVRPLQAGEIVPVDIEILPSGTIFEPGSRLRLIVQGRDVVPHAVENHRYTVNGGDHEIHTGGEFDSYLLVPDVTEVLR